MNKLSALFLVLIVAVSSSGAGEGPTPVPIQPKTPNDEKALLGPDGRDWPGIFRNLQSPDTVVRDAAVTDLIQGIDPLAKNSKKPYFAKLKTNLESKDLVVHDEAAKKVKLIGQVLMVNDRRFRPMLAGLQSIDPAVRNEQLEFIFKSTEESLQSDHVRDLIDQLGSNDPEAVKTSTAELTALGAEAADDLAGALDEEKVQIKKAAASILLAMGPAAKDAVNSLVFKIKDGDDKLGRSYAAKVLEGLGADAAEGVDDLVLSLDDEDKILRRICFNVLKKMGTAYKEASSDLVSYLTSDDKGARNLAQELLINLGAEAKIGAHDLIEIIDEPQPAPPPAGAPPAAQNAESANDLDAKIRAAKVLANIGPAAKEALPGLKKFANDNEATLKAAVQEAIDKITEGKPIDEVIKTIPKAADTPPPPPTDKPEKSRPGENF